MSSKLQITLGANGQKRLCEGSFLEEAIKHSTSLADASVTVTHDVSGDFFDFDDSAPRCTKCNGTHTV